MPNHDWSDDWPHWDKLHVAINEILGSWRYWHVGSHGKEKYGTFRDHVWFYSGNWAIHELVKPGHVYYRWPRWVMHLDLQLGRAIQLLHLYKPIQWYQKWVYNITIQRACRRYPEIIDELVSDLDFPELIRPGVFGNVDGLQIHSKYWITHTEESVDAET